MKVLVLIDELAPGSAPKVIGQTIKGLSKLGYECEGLVLVNNSFQDRFPEIYNYHLSGAKINYVFGKRPWWDLKLPGFSFFSLHHLFSFFVAPFKVKTKAYDIIIANAQFSTFAAWGLKIFRGVPYIFYAHCDPCTHTLRKTYLKTWLKFFYPLIYFFANLLDYISMFGAKVVIVSGKLHGQRFSRIAKTPLEELRLGCFPAQEFVPYRRRQKAILAFDRWDIGNRPEVFLELLSGVDNDVKLKIGGFWHPESLKEAFFSEVEKRALSGRVDYLGPLDENMIRKLCSEVILHVHLNQEAFGMQTLEAAACGACVIIPKGSGSADLFQDGVQGYFPESGDFSGIIASVKIIFSDSSKAEMMGRQAWEVAKKYTWANYASELAKIISNYS